MSAIGLAPSRSQEGGSEVGLHAGALRYDSAIKSGKVATRTDGPAARIGK